MRGGVEVVNRGVDSCESRLVVLNRMCRFGGLCVRGKAY